MLYTVGSRKGDMITCLCRLHINRKPLLPHHILSYGLHHREASRVRTFRIIGRWEFQRLPTHRFVLTKCALVRRFPNRYVLRYMNVVSRPPISLIMPRIYCGIAYGACFDTPSWVPIKMASIGCYMPYTFNGSLVARYAAVMSQTVAVSTCADSHNPAMTQTQR